MRYKFFPGSELSPPRLLGGIVDLDKPQHLVANVFRGEDDEIEVSPINDLPEIQMQELVEFANTIQPNDFERVPVHAIMQYTSRRKAMC